MTTPNNAVTLLSSMQQKGNKESRASEALAMKDEQMRILGEQNAHLLQSLNQMDDEITTLKMTKATLEEENRQLRDQNFECQSKTRAAETNLKKVQAGMEERETQVRVLTDHNTELLRLLEHEESETSALTKETSRLHSELDALQTRFQSLLATAKTHEEMATRATRESQLRAEEIRLLRNENDQLRACNTELKMKTQVEVEALQEQLRVRKEKQYQLLEKVQQLEEIKRQSDDQVMALEEKLRKANDKLQELETQLQLETKAKRAQMDANKNFFIENGNLLKDKQELQQRMEKAEQERLRMEAENRDSADQLREMAEKVFQLLERLKLAELGKTKAIDALKSKEVELNGLQKKNARLLKEGTKEGKARVKSEMDKKVLVEQIQALKKHNAQLSLRCSEEVKSKLKEEEERKQLEEKIKTMSGRIAFLLNKMQADEEAKIVTKEEMKKMHAQLTSLQEKNAELTQKLFATAESNRVVTEALRCKQDELDQNLIKLEAAHKKLGELALAIEQNEGNNPQTHPNNQQDTKQEAEDQVAMANGRFFVETKASNGGLLVIKAKRTHFTAERVQQAMNFLEKIGINAFLKRAQKSLNTKQLLVDKICLLLNQLMACDDDVETIKMQMMEKEQQYLLLMRKNALLQERLTTEEDAKRKTLLRYVHEIKAHCTATEPGVLKLPESGVGDEEVHAIAALLRNATNVNELQLRNNAISNDGARAIAAVLSASTCPLRLIDLRMNRIGKEGLGVLAEALERNEKIKHVYVHAGGKIEALGTTTNAVNAHVLSTGGTSDTRGLIGVETVCVVDVRDQTVQELAVELPEDDKEAGGPKSTPASILKLQLIDKHQSPKLFAKRPISAATLEKKLKEKQLQRKKKIEEAKEAKRNARKEAEWAGRAGGLELAALSPSVHKKLPPLASSMHRSSSAPSVKKQESDPAT